MKSITVTFVAMGLSLVGSLTGCSFSPATAQSIGGDWVRFTDPTGRSVEHPRGWSVDKIGRGLLVHSQDGACFALVEPFTLDHPGASTEACVRTVVPALGRFFPDASITATKPLSRPCGAVVAALTYQKNGQEGDARLICSLDSAQGVLYAIAAPHSQFQSKRSAMMRILQSLRTARQDSNAADSADRAAAAAPPMEFVSWIDPREGAFHMDVPAGWMAEGGMVRLHALDVRPSVIVTSPDGETGLQFGDAGLPAYMPPNSMLAMAGFREGSTYSMGGLYYRISRHISGVDYGRAYVRHRITAPFSDLREVSATDRPDIAQPLQQKFDQSGGGMVHYRVSVGEIDFTCRRNDKPECGACYMMTVMTQVGQFAYWGAFPVGYVAPAGRTADAEAAVRRMVDTFQIEPAWSAGQSNTAMQVSRITTQTNQQISHMIDDSYWKRQAIMDDISRKRSNAILDQTDLKDPGTGENYKAPSGYNHYYRKGNTVVGTNSAYSPGIDFTPLTEW